MPAPFHATEGAETEGLLAARFSRTIDSLRPTPGRLAGAEAAGARVVPLDRLAGNGHLIEGTIARPKGSCARLGAIAVRRTLPGPDEWRPEESHNFSEQLATGAPGFSEG